MEMEPQVPLEHESGFHLVSIVAENGGSSVTNSLQDHAAPQQPVKKQTRQWAAWTHQEEENFFSALRQVGKNFEKITCRVQSKNKDQVRHYYYRLVRRMNKLLGPELWLDAKNSKDTNAAMLRWWSLLEKYSCKASKLHLKPRRFKLIVETLENQLLKDRKKTVRKRSSQGENCSLNIPTSVFVDQSRIPVHDSRPMKPVLVDSQNIQKFSTGKGSSVKRQVNIGINRNNYKADSSSAKSSKHRRKTVGGSTAAYKRWEKAAIAGVSLVADAAEHLERTSTDKEVEHVQDVTEQNGYDDGDKDAPSLPNNLQSSMKLKLQLFPVDENTRRALEMDNRNPYLELTLSTRKKIPSVLEHLNRKWGTSSVASGNLMLFPYSVQNVNMVSYHRWTKDSTLNAGDVYALIGSPPVFRLRYGWFLDTAIEPVTSQVPFACSNERIQRMNLVNENILDSVSNPNPPNLHKYEKISDLHKDPLGSATKMSLATSSSVCTELIQQYNMPVGISGSSGHASASLLDAEGETAVIIEQDKHQGDSGTQKTAVLSAGEWADSLTNISIGDLLESSGNDEVDCVNSHWPRISGSLPQIPFSCDSFDDAIAAHIRKHEKRISSSPPLLSHASSIWDAEETCDAFSFQKNIFSEKVDAFSKSSLGTFGEIAQGSSAEPARETEELSDVDKALVDDDHVGHLTDKFESDGHTSDSSIRDLNGLTDIYWPDSLGPLDLDILPSSCRYHNDDLILSDSLGGLSRLIASSLDAFQNCSFFGSERKDTPTSTNTTTTTTTATVQAGESACVSNIKMGH